MCIDQASIAEITALSITKTLQWSQKLAESISERENIIARPILKEITARLQSLSSVGLEYLTLSRGAATLAGGEAQRIRLASQIGSGLTGVLYVLDEPSIGLHQRDNRKLISTLKKLRDLGNTVIVVEHDREVMEESDWIFDFGPKAGAEGGKIIFSGTCAELKKSPSSSTGKYLKDPTLIAVKHVPRASNGALLLTGACQNNLKNITVSFPLGQFICVTGLSGSGKSTLVVETLYPALVQSLNRFSRASAGHYEKLDGVQLIDKVVMVDQSPIGRTPKSNPATYTGLFTHIREIFARHPDAKSRGYKAGRFSFNVKGGRCEACEGEGQIKIEMQFLSDVFVTCEVCRGKRYNEETLEVRFKGKNIAEILAMTAQEAVSFYTHVPPVKDKLQTLCDVGLGYVHLGQPAPTLSGGEAQRVKLSAELSRRQTGRTVYILDEPTTGLHFADIQKLLEVLVRLVNRGNTVVVIEHNLDVIKNADNIIDLGPHGGDGGGKLLAAGTPKEISQVKSSYTGQFLKEFL